ncbi:hypothetical protein NDU88_002307 [Pleurodeles waltl]|uniref:Uncharacterized protein n=1 Tax=Pleurodeles waltl TaxID=8319 RepID=A0AAV7Q6B3_PLEWA|nr:hypothetical protein NDU88_002307 [Pleurodeles waltl]
MAKRRCRKLSFCRPPAAVTLPAQIILPDNPALHAVPPPEPHVAVSGTKDPSGIGIGRVSDDIRKSLAALAPPAHPGPLLTPLPGLVLPAPSGPLPARLPEPHAQDPSRAALVEVSKLLAGINAPAPTAPPPTAPWEANDAWQNTVADLKRQVDALVAAHSSIPVQVSNSGPSVAPAPSTGLTSPPLVQTALPSTSKPPGPDILTKEGTADSLLSRPGIFPVSLPAVPTVECTA